MTNGPETHQSHKRRYGAVNIRHYLNDAILRDGGHEWRGALCYTVYDKKQNRFVVIMASATD